MSAAKTAERNARAWAFAAAFEGAAKEARETPEETDAVRAENAVEAAFLADARRTARGAVMPAIEDDRGGGEGRVSRRRLKRSRL